MAYRLEILGTPRVVSLDGDSSETLAPGKPLALLSYLALKDRPVSREELSSLLWPNSQRHRRFQSVRQAVWLIRRTLGEEALAGDGLLELPDSASSDVSDFRRALRDGDADRARDLWRGTLLSEMVLPECREWDLWLDEMREAFRQDFFHAVLDAGVMLRDEGRLDEAEGFLEEAVRASPFSLPARTAHLDTLIGQKQLAPARLALEDARREVGDQEGADEALSELEERLLSLQAHPQPPESGSPGGELSFVGRSEEMGVLEDLWQRARLGEGTAAFIDGPAGIGKSLLASEVLDLVRVNGGQVARVKGYQHESAISCGTVGDLARELMALPGAAGVSPAAELVLRSTAPSLSRNGGDLPPESVPQPAALADALADLLEAIAFENPLAVFVDDVQWVDEESRSILAKVIRRARGTACLFLLSSRNVPRVDSSSLPSVFPDAGDFHVIQLGPLDWRDIEESLTLQYEVSPSDMAPELTRRLHEASSGNPLVLVQILRGFAADGVSRREEDRWVLEAGKVPQPLEPPESVQHLVDPEPEGLAPEAKKVESHGSRFWSGIDWRVAGLAALLILVAVPVAVFLAQVGGAANAPPSANPSEDGPGGSVLGIGFGPEQFVPIAPGTFEMGSVTGPDSERPIHTVHITRSFEMQKTEVTEGQWRAVMGTNPSGEDSCGDLCPVVHVSWDDVQEFLVALNAMDPGKDYRLPTEAEWEYAARAGTTGEVAGTGVRTEMGWSVRNSRGAPHSVATRKANDWGLYDMHGNVHEWVQDWRGPYPEGPVTDPTGPATGANKVSRGGTWASVPIELRSGFRRASPVWYTKAHQGFRLARGGRSDGPVLGRGFGDEQFASVPAGSFQMGSSEGSSNERPVHIVHITRPFQIQKTEVTVGQWREVMGTERSDLDSCGDLCAVVQVSWEDVQEFLDALNARDPGRNYRLPTEAEWEYAACAGAEGDFGGTGVPEEMAWYADNSAINGLRQVHPVAGKKPNAWGLYDVHGNVSEWVQDWYHTSYYERSPTRDPTGPESGTGRVVRGGGWGNPPYCIRCSFRDGSPPTNLGSTIGFRVVRSARVAEEAR